MLVSLLRMRYILKALQKLSALDLVPLKLGGCFPRKLVLSSTGVVMVAWAVTGCADIVVVCSGIGGAADVEVAGGLGGVEIATCDVTSDDNDAGLLVIQWSML